jgi:hypothetical protein
VREQSSRFHRQLYRVKHMAITIAEVIWYLFHAVFVGGGGVRYADYSTMGFDELILLGN